MKFADIRMLFFLWAIPALLLVMVYGLRRRKRILANFASAKGLSRIIPAKRQDRRKLKNGLILLCLLLLCLALTGPQYGYQWQDVARKGVDIIVALDCSRSMLATDISPNRLDRAKRKIYDLLHILRGDRVGLAAFAGTAFLQCPLTLDYSGFNIFLQALTPDFLPVGGTDIAEAIRVSAAAFDATHSEKAVILITDGEHSGVGDPIEAAKQALNAGIKIFCIGVGGEDGAPIPAADSGFQKNKAGNIVLSKLDEDALKKIAVLTGGVYIRSVAGDMDLEVIYQQEIRGKMDAQTLAAGRRQVWENRFQWLLALAAAVLAAEILLSPLKTGNHALEKNPISSSISALLIITLLLFSPNYAAAGHVREGLEAYQQGDYELALKKFIDAQLEDPDKPEIIYNIGNAYYKIEDFAAAAKNYREVQNSENHSLRQQAAFNLGNANYRLGKLEDAINSYQEALNLDSNDTLARQNLTFAQKMLELQQQEPPPQCDGDQKGEQEPQDGEQADSDREPSEGQSQEQGANEAQTPPADEEPDEEASADLNNETPEAEDDSASAQASPQEAPESPEDDAKPAGQAAQMLNRLKDQPGKAMMPRYHQRTVEKDW